MRCWTLATAFCTCLLLPVQILAQDKRPMTFDDVMAVKQVGETKISPDGKWIVYTLTNADLKTNEKRSEIWMVPAAGGKPRRFTSGKTDRAPEWSPDGQWIAFLSVRGEAGPAGGTTAKSTPGGTGDGPRAQVYLISPFGGEADKLTDSKTGVTAFAWSPDSTRIAYVAQRPLTDAEEKRQKDKDDAQVVDTKFRFEHLWIIEVDSKKATEIAKSDLVISDPQWAPDGKRLAYTAHPTPRADDGSLSDIYIANADGSGSPHKLLENEGPDSAARWSPDGKWIAFNSRDGKNGVLGFQHLYVISPEGGKQRAVAPDFDGTPLNVLWSRDSATLYFQALQRTTQQIFSVPAAGGAVKQLTVGDAVYAGLSLARSTDKMAFTRSDLLHPAEAFLSPCLDPVKLTDHNPQLKDLGLGRGEVIRWKSKDGMEIEGILIYPPGHKPGQRYPLLANIHGGPSGVWTQNFPGSWVNYAHVWAGKGWLVFLPNVRGSSGYGEKFLLANVRDWGRGDYQDIQAGLDDLVKRSIADPDKMGQTGWSYGGYMSAWTLTQTQRFKAVMVGAGLTNMYSMYSTNDLQRLLEGYFGAAPWNDLDAYTRASAMSYIKKAKTPTLIMHGSNDTRVPLGQAQELYMGLRKNNVPVQMVLFPREGHGLSEPRHQLDKMKREYAWFAKYVQGIAEAAE